MYFGIDLTSTENRPSACVCLDDRPELIYCGLLNTDDDIVAAVSISGSQVVAIDAPLSLPLGLCCLEEGCDCQQVARWKGRWCEQELARKAAPCYFTTKKSIIKRMVYRGIRLKERLNNQGCEVLEVYPYASKLRLWGKPVPSKARPQGLGWLRRGVGSLLEAVAPYVQTWSHDLCDAAIAAYTAYLYAHNGTEAVGIAEEGVIHIPRGNCGRKVGG